jgi:hypothetical protein
MKAIVPTNLDGIKLVKNAEFLNKYHHREP